jgi:hypothetical protein
VRCTARLISASFTLSVTLDLPLKLVGRRYAKQLNNVHLATRGDILDEAQRAAGSMYMERRSDGPALQNT